MSAGARLRPILRETRARLRHGLGLVLRPLVGTRADAPPIDLSTIRSVLVVRINGRLGNTLFMTPLLRQLHELLPQASIDLAVSYPNAATLLAGMPGLERIIVFPHKGGAGMAGRYLRALRMLRRREYDLAIEPTQFSTSGRIVLALSRSRYRLGFATPTQWAPLTHAVPPPGQVLHMGAEPTYLLAHGLRQPFDASAARLWLPLSTAELAAGKNAITAALAAVPATVQAGPGSKDLIGFFAHATGLKHLGKSWWLQFWSAFLELAPSVQPVEFLPSPGTPATNPAFAALNLPAQRLLTAAIANTGLYLSADGGPMHLAGSTDTPTVGLFNGHSDPKLYGPLKPADLSIDIRGLTPREVALKVYALWSGTGK